MRTALWALVAMCLMGALDSAAELRPPRPSPEEGQTLAASATDVMLPATQAPDLDPVSRPTPAELRWRNAALIAGGSLLIGAYGNAKWWNDGFTGRFRTQNEGWFGQDTKSGGADKLGHAFFAYTAARLFASGFEAVGNEPRQASRLGFWSSLGVMTAVEVADGYSRQYRFSREDAILNVAGAGLGYLMEQAPELDRLVDFRLLYKRSANSNFDPAGDYSGQKYLLIVKASGIPELRHHNLMRYFELALGYGTRGYENAPGVERTRNAYFGVSLNLSELLRQTVFRGAQEPGRAQRSLELFFEFVQVPGTAALADHRL